MRESLGTSAPWALLAVAALAGLTLAASAAAGDDPPPSRAPGLLAAAGSPSPAPLAKDEEHEAEAVETADPCAVGRAIARLGACLTLEDCAAARLWERRFGPARPAPVAPDRRAGGSPPAPPAVCPASPAAVSPPPDR